MKPSDEDLDRPLPPLTEEALQRLVRLHDGAASEDDWADYAQWSRLSVDHRAASADAERLWEALGHSPATPRRFARPALAVLLALFLAGGWQAERQGWLADQRTGSGERRELTLADGSRLELAPHTRVDLALDGERRVLRLHGGELHVQVAADPSRPFEVEAAGGRIRALGTGFDVRREGDRVSVVVTEHSVLVSQDGAEQRLESGQRLAFGPDGLRPPEPADVQAATGWRRGRLVFDGQPLGEVLDQLGDYQDGLILIRDERLRALPVTGVFATDDVPAQLELLQKSLPIRIRHWPWLTLVDPADD
ncbi:MULTISPECIES: FecR domain-containing protein [unclassified Pseudomonas]|uniref:FecR family protein n=1 Tax=unclassified Pseudomonas TaxID=196821 RepID=UPI00244AC3FB|nr:MULTISPECIES: FecR domain-containing protein [unclassified Pseudomonas]MDG9930604.1 FecR domain-containing protein [Pseudomonas sp. GD04042]MDH0485101.1 FecR domain-containing protein [Pseudomonas sp. GD04015]MDH0605719.1 FecR domain-containing protein [Pseudomonas sp. GD03869]